MEILYVLIPIGLIILCIAIGAFFWAIKNHQFDHLESAGNCVLEQDQIIDTGEDSS
ncbi:MAG: cbb3-type cytochrome oxidase assembly protein CcoS [Pseudomonadota bacterium]